jgi:hypothetical protein
MELVKSHLLLSITGISDEAFQVHQIQTGVCKLLLKLLTLMMSHPIAIDAAHLEEGIPIRILRRGGVFGMIGANGTKNRPLGIILVIKIIREGFTEHAAKAEQKVHSKVSRGVHMGITVITERLRFRTTNSAGLAIIMNEVINSFSVFKILHLADEAA